MFKRKFFVVFLLFSSSFIWAYEPEIAIGTKHGGVASTILFPSNSIVKPTYTFGYTGGVYTRLIFEKYFGLQVELNYMQRGWQEKEKSFSYVRQTHYLELPFITHIFFGKKKFRWFFNLGLNLGVYLGEKKSENIIDSHNHDKVYKQHELAVANKFDYGICGGTGFEFHTKAGIYQLDARYHYGLGDIFPNTIKDDFGRSSNQNISICLGVLFDVNKLKKQRALRGK
ncbi:MAG: PorT family protein [Paludibacteraceae bacterium]|nr:PorT family protein [Paludibacteraceae bacterium]